MTDPTDKPLSTLRAGSRAEINVVVVRRVAVGLVLATLAVLVVVLTVAGFHKNSQITDLQTKGVPVTVTVTGCEGLLGGSGSNAAGYLCRGSFTLDGQRYTEDIPGSTFYRPGHTLGAITVRNDPGLLGLAGAVGKEHTSDRVFVLPAILAVVLVVLGGLVLLRRRSHQHANPSAPQGP